MKASAKYANGLILVTAIILTACTSEDSVSTDQQTNALLSYDFGDAEACLKYAKTLVSAASQTGDSDLLRQAFAFEDEARNKMLAIGKSMDMPATDFLFQLTQPGDGVSVLTNEESCRRRFQKPIKGNVSTTKNIKDLQSVFDENSEMIARGRERQLEISPEIKKSFDNLKKSVDRYENLVN
jgi:hypothetical protein